MRDKTKDNKKKDKRQIKKPLVDKSPWSALRTNTLQAMRKLVVLLYKREREREREYKIIQNRQII